MNQLINTNASMTSKEIAELVGKREDSVKRTIERLVEKSVISNPPMVDGIKTPNGVTPKHHLFQGEEGKRDSIVVVAQLSPEFTAHLVDRWSELEKEKTEMSALSEIELIARIATHSAQQQRQINQVSEKAEHVHEAIEQIKRGTIPEGWIGYSLAAKKTGLTNSKCRTLVEQYRVPEDVITILTPDSQPRPMKIIFCDDFMTAFRAMMNDAERRGTRWYHPNMGLFQAIGWEAE